MFKFQFQKNIPDLHKKERNIIISGIGRTQSKSGDSPAAPSGENVTQLRDWTGRNPK